MQISNKSLMHAKSQYGKELFWFQLNLVSSMRIKRRPEIESNFFFQTCYSIFNSVSQL